jgi:hypothetical protein
MAHYLAPPGQTAGYDADNRLAPGSLWRMRILVNQRRKVVLWGGMNLTVKSNNPLVVPNDAFQEDMSPANGLRYLSLLGKGAGTTMLEASLGTGVWCALQVHVGDVDLTANPVPMEPFKFDIPFDHGPGGLFPISGSIPVAIGAAAVIRIPVPGTRNLAIEFFPRNYKGQSTSTLFIQDLTGKIHLRLDHGPNVVTKTVDYHWNAGSKQKGGMQADFGIRDHQVLGPGGRSLYKFAKYFRWGGRVLVVVGATVDVISIVQSSNPLKTASQVVAGWAGAWAGCKVVGAFGAGVGTGLEPGVGTAIGGLVGCVIGGAAGYTAASATMGHVYDWGEGALFHRLPEVSGYPATLD